MSLRRRRSGVSRVIPRHDHPLISLPSYAPACGAKKFQSFTTRRCSSFVPRVRFVTSKVYVCACVCVYLCLYAKVSTVIYSPYIHDYVRVHFRVFPRVPRRRHFRRVIRPRGGLAKNKQKKKQQIYRIKLCKIAKINLGYQFLSIFDRLFMEDFKTIAVSVPSTPLCPSLFGLIGGKSRSLR